MELIKNKKNLQDYLKRQKQRFGDIPFVENEVYISFPCFIETACSFTQGTGLMRHIVFDCGAAKELLDLAAKKH